MWMTLVGFLAAAAFWAWWTTGRARWGAAYALLAGFGLWVHLGSGPFLAAPFVWLVGAKIREAWRGSAPPERPGWLATVAVGAGAGLAALAFLGPAHETLLPLISQKQGANVPMGWDTAGHLVQLTAGTGIGWLAGLLWLTSGLGWVLLWRRRPDLATFSAVLVAGHVVGLLVLSPLGLAHPIIFNRYVLIALPWALVWGAVVLGFAMEWLGRRLPPSRAVAGRTALLTAVVVALVAVGPLTRFWFVGGSFSHHNLFLLYSVEPPEPRPGTFSEVYQRLAARGEPGAVVEYPWFWFWNTNLSFPLAQAIHRRDVVVAMHLPQVLRESVRFHNTTPAAPEALLESRGRFLLVHKNVLEEFTSRMAPAADGGLLRAPANHTLELLRRDWGPPFYEDPSVAAWDLAEVRARVE